MHLIGIVFISGLILCIGPAFLPIEIVIVLTIFVILIRLITNLFQKSESDHDKKYGIYANH